MLIGSGGGGDVADYSDSPGGVTVNLARTSAQNTGSAGLDTLNGVERINGSAHADILAGDAAVNVLWGLAGDDQLLGGEGNDLLEGGAGNDTLSGDGGLDTASYAGAVSGVTVSLAVAGAQDTLGAGIDTLIGVERLQGSAFADWLTGDAAANTLRGGGGDDVLVGGGGNDTLEGGAGNDRILSGDGLADTASYAGATAGVSVDLTVTTSQNTVGAGRDILSAVENLGGSNHGDILRGDSTNNVLSGAGGADQLFGGDGDDRLIGGAGDDVLDCGTGSNTLTGGTGGDRFIFAPTGTQNVIADFEDGVDLIDLTALGPSPYYDVSSLQPVIQDDYSLYLYVDSNLDDVPFQIIVVKDFLLKNPNGWLTTDDILLA